MVPINISRCQHQMGNFSGRTDDLVKLSLKIKLPLNKKMQVSIYALCVVNQHICSRK